MPHDHEKHICLATFKRDGTAVETPVWFAEANRMLYLRTIANSGKVKRIRNNPSVRLALDTKYGDERRHMTRLMSEQGKELVYVGISLT